MDAHKNFAVGVVAVAPSPASSGTSLTLQAGQGARLPATPFNATVGPQGLSAVAFAEVAEIVRVTKRTGDVLEVIERKQEGTAARAIAVGDVLSNAVTAKALTDIEAAAGESPVALKALGNVSGVVKLDLALATTFSATLVGATEFEVINAPAKPTDIKLIVTQDATGGRTWSIKGISWIGSEPVFGTTKGLMYFVPMLSIESGASLYGTPGLEGPSPSVEAMTGMCYSALNSTTTRISANSEVFPTAKKARFQLLIVPKEGKITKVWVRNGATAAGNTRVGILDTGQAAVGENTLIVQSAEVAQTGTEAWQLIELPEHVYSAGQGIMLGVMNSGTTGTYGCTAGTINAKVAELPEGALGSGVKVAVPKLIAVRTFAAFEFVSLVVANMEAAGIAPPAVIAKVE